ncbi:hypothetical protein LTR48_004618 [Friedmanniomyces endolithicus]|uniref:Uncharacterized protein n=1 Tax=Rachicladosporium monterosium TaxID=1507873 RepID=A0ABR0L4H0_9PEZI|nr:hypothetical protein LTR29_005940 [Friedmanniomyces endolithicus]KAK1085348.1 hypothetical protein LTR48_004618 [Friedmanniomyces endolithicus]KAK5143319.1 hypothetical protein LTR32_004524 [Rachicladosporium monterosium]
MERPSFAVRTPLDVTDITRCLKPVAAHSFSTSTILQTELQFALRYKSTLRFTLQHRHSMVMAESKMKQRGHRPSSGSLTFDQLGFDFNSPTVGELRDLAEELGIEDTVSLSGGRLMKYDFVHFIELHFACQRIERGQASDFYLRPDFLATKAEKPVLRQLLTQHGHRTFHDCNGTMKPLCDAQLEELHQIFEISFDKMLKDWSDGHFDTPTQGFRKLPNCSVNIAERSMSQRYQAAATASVFSPQRMSNSTFDARMYGGHSASSSSRVKEEDADPCDPMEGVIYGDTSQLSGSSSYQEFVGPAAAHSQTWQMPAQPPDSSQNITTVPVPELTPERTDYLYQIVETTHTAIRNELQQNDIAMAYSAAVVLGESFVAQLRAAPMHQDQMTSISPRSLTLRRIEELKHGNGLAAYAIMASLLSCDFADATATLDGFLNHLANQY